MLAIKIITLLIWNNISQQWETQAYFYKGWIRFVKKNDVGFSCIKQQRNDGNNDGKRDSISFYVK